MNKAPYISWSIANFEKLGSILLDVIYLIFTAILAPYGTDDIGNYFVLQLFILVCIDIVVGGILSATPNALGKLLLSIVVVAILIFLGYTSEKYYYLVLTTTIIATVIGGAIAFVCSRFAYLNFEDVVSRRYIIYGSSHVGKFEDRWRYTLDRFVVIFGYFIMAIPVMVIWFLLTCGLLR